MSAIEHAVALVRFPTDQHRRLVLGLARLIVAFRLFVMFLCLTRRRYPIDYLKHVEERVGEWLGRLELLPRMREMLALSRLDRPTLRAKALLLRRLLDQEQREEDSSASAHP